MHRATSLLGRSPPPSPSSTSSSLVDTLLGLQQVQRLLRRVPLGRTTHTFFFNELAPNVKGLVLKLARRRRQWGQQGPALLTLRGPAFDLSRPAREAAAQHRAATSAAAAAASMGEEARLLLPQLEDTHVSLGLAVAPTPAGLPVAQLTTESTASREDVHAAPLYYLLLLPRGGARAVALRDALTYERTSQQLLLRPAAAAGGAALYLAYSFQPQRAYWAGRALAATHRVCYLAPAGQEGGSVLAALGGHYPTCFASHRADVPTGWGTASRTPRRQKRIRPTTAGPTLWAAPDTAAAPLRPESSETAALDLLQAAVEQHWGQLTRQHAQGEAAEGAGDGAYTAFDVAEVAGPLQPPPAPTATAAALAETLAPVRRALPGLPLPHLLDDMLHARERVLLPLLRRPRDGPRRLWTLQELEGACQWPHFAARYGPLELLLSADLTAAVGDYLLVRDEVYVTAVLLPALRAFAAAAGAGEVEARVHVRVLQRWRQRPHAAPADCRPFLQALGQREVAAVPILPFLQWCAAEGETAVTTVHHRKELCRPLCLSDVLQCLHYLCCYERHVDVMGGEGTTVAFAAV